MFVNFPSLFQSSSHPTASLCLDLRCSRAVECVARVKKHFPVVIHGIRKTETIQSKVTANPPAQTVRGIFLLSRKAALSQFRGYSPVSYVNPVRNRILNGPGLFCLYWTCRVSHHLRQAHQDTPKS